MSRAEELITWPTPPGIGNTNALAFDGNRIVAGDNVSKIALWEIQRPPIDVARRRQVVRLAAELVDRLYPRLISAQRVREELLRDQSLPADVRAEALRLVDVRGDNPWGLNMWAWSIVTSSSELGPPGRQFDTDLGYHMAGLAACLAPEAPGILNTWGMALYRAGEYERAIEVLLTAERHAGPAFRHSLALDQALLAICYARLARWHEARAALERASDYFRRFGLSRLDRLHDADRRGPDADREGRRSGVAYGTG